MACPTRSAGCWRRARSISKACRTSSSRRCASSCPIPRISRTWTPPSRAWCARCRRARRSWCSATTTSTAPPRRRCCCASSARRRQHRRLHSRPAQGRLRPQHAGAARLKEQGASVVITVDCGVTAFEPLAEAKRVGLDLIVIDHHMAEIALPQAVAVVDPNRLDDASPHKQMAAVGVAFLLAVGVNRALREAGWYGSGAQRARPAPMARPRGAGHGVRCRAADRRQPRAGAPGPAGDGRAGQHRPGGTGRRGAPARAAGRLSSRLHAGPARQCRRPRRAGRSRRAAAVQRRSAGGRRAGAQARRVQRRAPRHRARGARPGDRPHRGALRPRPQGPAVGAGGRERGLACRRDRHRREPPGRTLRPAGLRDRHGRRAGQGVGPLGQGRRSRRGGDRGAAGGAAGERRRPRHGRRPDRGQGSLADLAKFLDERIAPQLGAAPPCASSASMPRWRRGRRRRSWSA